MLVLVENKSVGHRKGAGLISRLETNINTEISQCTRVDISVITLGWVLLLAGQAVLHLMVAEMKQGHFSELAGTLGHLSGAGPVVVVPEL